MFFLCNPVDYSTPGFPVLPCLPEFAQTWIHRVSDATQPSPLLLPPSPPALNLSDLQHWVFSYELALSEESLNQTLFFSFD